MFVSDVDLHMVKVLDTAGNMIARIGRWGNAETVPGADGDARQLGFRLIYCLAAAGDNLYVSDKDLRRIAKIKMGQTIELTVPAYPDEIFEGAVCYIGDVVDEESRAVKVRAEVSNDHGRLKAGISAQVEILLNGAEQLLVVPVAAVLEDGPRKIVFVNEIEHFVQREIQTGAVDGDRVQVLAGLAAGERVVVEGNHQLRSVLSADVMHPAHTH